MTIRRRGLVWEPLEDRTAPAINILFDYTYDTNDFFGTQERKDAMERVATELEAVLEDTLDAIQPGGGNSWTASFREPGSGNIRDTDNLVVPADTLIVYAGGRVLGTGILGIGGPGVANNIVGDQAWMDVVDSRGEPGVFASPASDFAPWGGAIAFDTTTDFYFGADASAIGANQYDFQSTALHELIHLIGWGTSDSWDRYVSGTDFDGPSVVITIGGPGPLDGDGAHWASGTTFGGVEPVMNVDTVDGVRQPFTDLDKAGLRDIGWDVLLPSTPTVTLTVSPTSAVEGSTITFTATVQQPSGQTIIPTGTIRFEANGASLAAEVTLDATGTATLQLDTLAVASYSITAYYSGDARYSDGLSNTEELTIIALPVVPPPPPPLPTVPTVPGSPPPPTDRPPPVTGIPYFADLLVLGTTGEVRGYVFEANQAMPVATSLTVTFPGFSGAARGVGADINGDGVADLIAVTGPEPADAPPNVPSFGSSVLTIVDGATGVPILLPSLVFESGFRGGMFVAAGDIDGDGRAEVVVSPDQGGGGRIVVYGYVGDVLQVRANFFGIEDLNFRGGARVAVADVDGDGFAEMVVGAGFGGGPRVAVFAGKTLFDATETPARLIGDFFAFGGPDAQSLRNGVYVAGGDLNGDGKADIAFGSGPGGGPRVMVISGAMLLPVLGDAALRSPLANFFAGSDTASRGGVRVAFKDMDADTLADLVVGNGDGAVNTARLYLGKNVGRDGEPELQAMLSPSESTGMLRGVYVG